MKGQLNEQSVVKKSNKGIYILIALVIVAIISSAGIFMTMSGGQNFYSPFGGDTRDTADITGSSVNLAVVAGGADPGIDRVAYAPPPFDVITSAGGNPVQAFTDFPLTL